MQSACGGEPVGTGESGGEDGDVRPERQRRGHHLVTAPQFRDHVNIARTGEKRH
jgi:hypothetical protein